MKQPQLHLTPELWRQDPHDPDLWDGPHGLMVNSAALAEREFYHQVIRLNPTAPSPNPSSPTWVY